MTPFLLGVLVVLVASPFLCVPIIAGLYALGAPAVRRRREMEDAKLRVLQLRAARLQNDLAVVENRAHKLSNDVVLGDLKIEVERRKLYALQNWRPEGGDSEAFR